MSQYYLNETLTQKNVVCIDNITKTILFLSCQEETLHRRRICRQIKIIEVIETSGIYSKLCKLDKILNHAKQSSRF